MNKTYPSRAEWYIRCKSDRLFYYDEMEKYATSNAYMKAVKRHKRIGNAEDIPETTKKELRRKTLELFIFFVLTK